MKTPRLIPTVLFVFLSFVSCKQYSNEEMISFQDAPVYMEEESTGATAKAASPGPCNPDAYEVTLESRTYTGGSWEWVWSVRNPNPGNGNNGTAKDLSHWGMRMTACFNQSSVTGAAYSGDGIEWTAFAPVYEAESSQDCMTTPVLKFDFGTTGTAKSYYRLVLNQEYQTGTSFAYYKAGQTCCTFNFTGINCSSGPVEIVE